MNIIVSGRKDKDDNGIVIDLKNYYEKMKLEEKMLLGTKVSNLFLQLYNNRNMHFEHIDNGKKGYAELVKMIKNENVDLIISYGVSLLEFRTLTNNYAMNLINIPQLYFCSKEEVKMIDSELAINIFVSEKE